MQTLLEFFQLLENLHMFYEFTDKLDTDDVICLSMVSKAFRRIFGRCSYTFWSTRYFRQTGLDSLMSPHGHIEDEKKKFSIGVLRGLEYKRILTVCGHAESPFERTFKNNNEEALVSICVTGFRHPMIGIEFPSIIKQYCHVNEIVHVMVRKSPTIDNNFIIIVEAILTDNRTWFRYVIDSKSKKIILGCPYTRCDTNLLMSTAVRFKKFSNFKN